MIYSRRMPWSTRPRRGLALAGALGAVALGALAGCGGQEESRPIPVGTATDILARLDEVERRVDAQACNDIREDSLPALRRQVDGLPERVDKQVKTTLVDGIGRLEELVNSECRRRPRRRPSEPTVTPTPQPQPPTQTQPGPPTTTQPETPAPQEPDSGGDGDGGSGSDGGDGSDGGGDGGGGSDGGGDGGGGGDGDDTGSLPGGGGEPGTDVGGGGALVAPRGAGGEAT